MSSFRRFVNITRNTPGSYVNGVYVSGSQSTITIDATIQPLSGFDAKNAPEGVRIEDTVKVYTDTELQQLDELVWQGNTYEWQGVDVRQMDVINHYKYYFTKVSLPNGF